MRKALSLYLPMWPVDLVRRRESRRSSQGHNTPRCAAPAERVSVSSATDVPPLLFVTMVANQQRIAACCERALACGVQPGMTLAHARALLPVDSARVLDHRPERDLAALRSLAEWMTRIAPIVAMDPPDGLLMDLSGCERLYRSDDQMVRQVARACTRLGLRSRVAIAPTAGCAWALARYGPARLSMVRPGPGGHRVREALAPLPVQALRIDEATVAALAEVGIEQIGHLLDVARSTLPSRFGDELLLRLDQALGEAMEVLEPVRPVPPPEAHMTFTGPTTRPEAIDEAARRLLQELCATLATSERGVRRLDVTLERIDTDNVAFTVSLSHPNRNPRHLWALLAPKLERANLGFGVESVRLIAARTGRLRHAQAECWRDEDAAARAGAERAVGELVDTLAGRLGPDRILRLEARQTHIPERVFQERSVVEVGPPGHAARLRRRREAVPDEEPVGDRPTLLLPRPEPAQVMAVAPEGPPRWLRWQGQEHTLISAIGPERISEEWWWAGHVSQRRSDTDSQQHDDSAPPARDYFKVQTESGRWLWLFRRLPAGRWYVHGEWS